MDYIECITQFEDNWHIYSGESFNLWMSYISFFNLIFNFFQWYLVGFEDFFSRFKQTLLLQGGPYWAGLYKPIYVVPGCHHGEIQRSWFWRGYCNWRTRSRKGQPGMQQTWSRQAHDDQITWWGTGQHCSLPLPVDLQMWQHSALWQEDTKEARDEPNGDILHSEDLYSRLSSAPGPELLPGDLGCIWAGRTQNHWVRTVRLFCSCSVSMGKTTQNDCRSD